MIKFTNVKNTVVHYLKLTKWLQETAVLAFYQGCQQRCNYQTIKKQLQTKIRNKNINCCFITCKKKKIGYLQFYYLDKKKKQQLNYQQWLKIIGFDLFLATKYQNRGLGKIVVSAFITYLDNNNISYNKIIVDPLCYNMRAIKCYQSCAFVPIKLMPNYQLHDGLYQDVLILEFNK